MARILVFWMLFGLCFSAYGKGGQPVRFVSKLTEFNRYHISFADADTIREDLLFSLRSRGDSLVHPIMAEIKPLLDSTCPGRNDSLVFNIFVTYNRNGEILKITYIIELDDIDCFSEDIYMEVYRVFVKASPTLPMAELIDAYWSRVRDIKRETGNTTLMFKYNSKTLGRCR